ncbi:MAG: DUF3137 domain-containing protein [Pseudomonadota bacterium]
MSEPQETPEIPQEEPQDTALPEAPESDLSRTQDQSFHKRIDALSHDAEILRLSYMKKHRMRGHITMTLGLLSLTAGAAGFGWFLLVEFDILRAVGSMILAIVLPALLHIWSAGTLKDYKKTYKREFLPRLAQALGGFKYHPARGIRKQIISKTGLIPAHDEYRAEDCFIGKYKGVKVLFSEARLSKKKSHGKPVFDGIFVLLEIPEKVIEGHTILTADKGLYRQWRNTRWQKLQDVEIQAENSDHNIFSVLSDAPETAKLLIGDRLLKELYEASDMFDQSPLSVALFRGKFIFMMIPYDGDMFEASSIHIPVETKQHAEKCKREIEQILEIIDVFDIYKKT